MPHADADDYFWVPTSPPYATKRAVAESLQCMEKIFLGRDAWVLSGSVTEGGDPLVEHFDAVVFLSVDQSVRLERLHARETIRFGSSIQPGGEREAAHRASIDWAQGYEDPEFDGRNRARHKRWLSALPCPVLRLDSAHPVDELVAEVIAWEVDAPDESAGT